MPKSNELRWLVVCFFLFVSERGKTETGYFDCAIPSDSSEAPHHADSV